MDKDVIVKVTGYQTDEDGQTDVNEEVFNAQYFNKNNTHYLIMEDERSAKTARYKFNHRYLEVVKNGDIHAKLTFEADKFCKAMYRTPYGRMPFVFETKSLTLSDGPDEIKVEVNYTISNENQKVSTNRTLVSVKQA